MDTCPLTGVLLLKNPTELSDSIYYELNLHGKLFRITLCFECYQKVIKETGTNGFEKHYPIILSLLVNGKFGEINSRKIHWDSNSGMSPNDKLQPLDLKTEIEHAVYPKTPKEKLDNLFIELYKLLRNEGEYIYLPDLKINKLWQLWYFIDLAQFTFYLRVLEEQGLIAIHQKQPIDVPAYKFTYKGLSYYVSQFEEGYNSKTCFVAMAFQPGMELTRQAIKNAIEKTGFLPFIVDEQHLNSDLTINDAIIAGLKKMQILCFGF